MRWRILAKNMCIIYSKTSNLYKAKHKHKLMRICIKDLRRRKGLTVSFFSIFRKVGVVFLVSRVDTVINLALQNLFNIKLRICNSTGTV